MSFAQTIEVQIKQNGKIIHPKNNVYELEKAPFQFEIDAEKVEGFLIGATFDKAHYLQAKDSFQPEDLWFQNPGIYEDLFNTSKELYFMDEASSYWYFTEKQDHRFDRTPQGTPTHWSATRTVAQLYDVLSVETVQLKEVNKSLYMLMFLPQYNEDYDVINKENLFSAELRFKN